MKLLKKCPLCSSEKLAHFLSSSDFMYQLSGDYHVVFCENCSLKFQNPQTGETELAEHYPQKYYSFAGVPKRSKIAEKLYSLYFSKKSSLFLKLLFFPIYPLIRGAKVISGGKILDIGCGSGVFLSRMKNLGMRVYGVDPFIAKDIPGLNIKKIDVVGAKFPANFFDVITMNNVLEHVGNPDILLKEIQRILKQDGTGIIGVPNLDSFLGRLFGKYWAELDLPRHLFFFNEKVLNQYCKKNGFKIVRARYNCVPFEITGSIFYWLNRHGKKKLSESILANNRILNMMFLPLCHILNLFKAGGRIEIYFRKI